MAKPKRKPYSEPLMDIPAYREKFLQELTDTKMLAYFDSMVARADKMLYFHEEYSVPGGAWPGNYGLVSITDYSTRMVRRGGTWVTQPNGDMDLVDCEGMEDLIPEYLPTTAENIRKAMANKRTSYYSLPYRFIQKYQERLLIKVCGEEAQASNLTEEMLAEALSEMTPFERSKYEQCLYRIDVSLYPSVEQPVRVRIDGIDDGAEEAFFGDMESALEALEEIAGWNSRDLRHRRGFQGTD